MEEFIKLFLGIVVLGLGIPIGNYLKSKTLDEMKAGRKWFEFLVSFGLVFGIVGLFLKIDWLMFSAFFISIVSSRSLIITKK